MTQPPHSLTSPLSVHSSHTWVYSSPNMPSTDLLRGFALAIPVSEHPSRWLPQVPRKQHVLGDSPGQACPLGRQPTVHATTPLVSLLSILSPALHCVQTHSEMLTEVYGVHP